MSGGDAEQTATLWRRSSAFVRTQGCFGVTCSRPPPLRCKVSVVSHRQTCCVSPGLPGRESYSELCRTCSAAPGLLRAGPHPAQPPGRRLWGALLRLRAWCPLGSKSGLSTKGQTRPLSPHVWTCVWTSPASGMVCWMQSAGPSVVVTVTGWLLPVLLVGAPECLQVETCPPQAGSQDSTPVFPAAQPGCASSGRLSQVTCLRAQGRLARGGPCPAHGELIFC